MSRRFLDAASGQPPVPLAIQALSGFADRDWADPASLHHEGRAAAHILAAARQTVAHALAVKAGSVSFHYAGIHAASAAIAGVQRRAGRGSELGAPAIAVSAIEREAVLAAAAAAAGIGGSVTSLPVDVAGRVDQKSLADFLSEISQETFGVVLIQAANIEIGTRQRLRAVSAACREADVPLVVDATGALGHCDLRDVTADCTALFADGFSWGGPRGGSVVVTSGSPPTDVDDVGLAVGTATALDVVTRGREKESSRLFDLIEHLRHRVAQTVPDVDILGDPDYRLPNTVTFSCLYADGERLASVLDRRGFAVGSGSACAAKSGLPSHVLAAIGALSQGNLRISLPLGCPSEHVEEFLTVLPQAVELVRAEAGAP